MTALKYAPLLALMLAACSSAPPRPDAPAPSASKPPQAQVPAVTPPLPDTAGEAERNNARVCRQVMQHDERNYTKGGLYAPKVADAHPDGELDVSFDEWIHDIILVLDNYAHCTSHCLKNQQRTGIRTKVNFS